MSSYLRCGALIACLLASACLWLADSAEAQNPNPRIVRVRCGSCHAEQFASTAIGPHAILDQEEWATDYGVQLSCLGCHGDVTEHMAANGEAPVFSFPDQPAITQNGVCLDCHRDTHPEFDSSSHARAGLACTSCHSQHQAERGASHLLRAAEQLLYPDLASPSALCADCHSDVASTFSLNERHRLNEGVLECTSCHDPHAPAARVSLGGFKQQACVTCHADKGGPFVFEHPASRVEGCTACHGPHGSPNRHLLAHQRVAELCIGCHAEIPQFHLGFSPSAPARFSLDTQCTNCHSTIHGSNFDPRFLR
jgi:DmsE family decaheme c-type cytochrome